MKCKVNFISGHIEYILEECQWSKYTIIMRVELVAELVLLKQNVNI